MQLFADIWYTRIMKRYVYLERAFVLFPILVLCVVAPVSFVALPQAKMLLLMLWVLIGVVALLWRSYDEKTLTLPYSPILVAPFGLPIAALISALVSMHPTAFFGSGVEIDTVATLTLLSLVPLFVVTIGRRVELVWLRIGLFSGVCAALVLYVFQIAAYVLVPNVLIATYPSFSLVGSWHDVALCAGLVVLAVGLWHDLMNSFQKKVAYALLACAAITLLEVSASDVWYVLAIVFFIYALARMYCAAGSLHARVRIVSHLLVFSATALVLGFVSPLIHAALPARVQVIVAEVRPSLGSTLAVSPGLFERPSEFVLGTGPNSFQEQWAKYKPVVVNTTEFWDTSFVTGIGLIPTQMVTGGFVALCAWLLLGAGVVIAFMRAIRDRRFEEVEVFLFVLFLTLFCIISVPSLPLLFLLFALLGYLVRVSNLYRTVSWPLIYSYRGAPVVFAIALIALVSLSAVIAHGSRIILSNVLVYRANTVLSSTSDIERVTHFLQQALALYPQNDLAHRAAVELGLRQLAGESRKPKPDTQSLQSILSETIEHGMQAVATNGGKYENWLVLAQMYTTLSGAGVSGATQEARRAFEKAAETNPTNPYPFLALAQLDALVNDATSTRVHLRAALKQKPDMAVAHYFLSRLEGQAGNTEESIAEGVLATRYAPQEPLVWFQLGGSLYLANRYQDAATALERAVELQPEYSDALYLLGLSYKALGHTEKARTTLETVLRLNPGNSVILQALGSLSASRSRK